MCKKLNLWPLRLELEAAIWRQGAPILAVNGLLLCPGGDPKTRGLIRLYNLLFGEINRQWLAADVLQDETDVLAFWADYEQEMRRAGPLAPGIYLESRERRMNGGGEIQ